MNQRDAIFIGGCIYCNSVNGYTKVQFYIDKQGNVLTTEKPIQRKESHV